MIKRVFAWIQSLYNSFSYTSKMRFLGFFGTACALMLFGMLCYVQYPLMRVVRLKSAALTQYLPLNALLQISCNFEVLLSKRDPKIPSKADIDQIIHLIEKHLDEIRSTMKPTLKENALVTPSNIRDFGHLLEKATQQWEGVKKEYNATGKLPLLSITAFSQDILDLIEFNMIAHRLNLNLFMSLFFLTDITLMRIPNMQVLVAEIMVRRSSVNDVENANLNVRLSESIADLKQTLAMVRDEVSQASNGYNHPAEKENETWYLAFAEYQNALGIYIESLNDKTIPISDLAALASTSLKKGWGFEDKMRALLIEDINYIWNILSFRQNMSLAIVGTGLLAFMGMYFTRLNRRPLEMLKSAAQIFSQGDLTVRVPITSNDEVARICEAFNEMADKYEENIEKTGTLTSKLVNTAGSIVDIARQLEINIKSQEKAINRIKIQAKDIVKSTNRLTDLLQEVNKSVGVTSDLALLSKSTLQEMETIMKQMLESSKLIVYTLAGVKEQIVKINGVLVTIVTIADQSNLLSLNTAIRASKTGRTGIGFSVVADKIRELADQTANTTLEVEESVQDIVNVVTDAVIDVVNFSSLISVQVDDEKKVNEELSERFSETQNQIVLFANIIVNMEQRLREFLQIDELISHLTQVTEEAGNSVRKLYHDAEFLYRSTNDFDELIANFKTTSKKKPL